MYYMCKLIIWLAFLLFKAINWKTDSLTCESCVHKEAKSFFFFVIRHLGLQLYSHWFNRFPYSSLVWCPIYFLYLCLLCPHSNSPQFSDTEYPIWWIIPLDNGNQLWTVDTPFSQIPIMTVVLQFCFTIYN